MPIKGIKGGIGSKALGYGLGAAEAVAEATDAEFNQTVLLLHGDGSEGAGNTAALGDPNYKAFKDNSTSAHAITVQGDAYGNDFSPYYYADGYWSNSISPNSGLTFPNSSAFAFGTGAFTIEFWVLGGADNDQDIVLEGRNATGTNFHITYGGYSTTTSNSLRYVTHNGTSITTGTDLIADNTWHHVAIERDGSNNVTLYIDGVSKGTGTDAGNYTQTTGTWSIGYSVHASSNYSNAYYSNFRIVKGSNVYGGAFSVPTTPLTAVTNTQLLTCQSNRFIDNSSNGLTLTLTGTPKVSTNTPFTVTKTANVGSGFFDGTGDYLETSSSQIIPSGNFTIEAFVYVTNSDATQAIVSQGTGSSDSGRIFLGIESGGSGAKWTAQIGGIQSYSSITPVLHTWHYIAMTYDGSTIRLYLNGTEIDTDSTTNNASNTTLKVGALWGAGYDFFGYISDIRISDTVRTVSSVPTTSLSSDSNTDLLTCQYSGAVRNVGFLDDSKYNHQITPNGDVNMGTFSPFSLEDGYWSNFFSNNHPIEIADSGSVLDLPGDFTIEFWSYETGISTGLATTNMYFTNEFLNRLQLQNTGSVINLYMNGSSIFNGTTPTLNQWNHIAIVREGSGSNNVSLYINGSRNVQGTSTYSVATTSLMIGGQDRGNPTGYAGFKGYISNFRILKGTALYSGTSITVPTAPLTAIANTSLLTCQSNRFVDNSTNGLTLTTDSSSPTEVQPFSPFAPSRSYSKDAVGGSAYFDGSGDYLSIPDSKDFTIGTNNFSLEFWFYPTAASLGVIYIQSNSGGTTYPIIVQFNANRTLSLFLKTSAEDNEAGTTVLPLNQWYWIQVVRTGSLEVKLYVNGSEEITVPLTSSTIIDSSDDIRIGNAPFVGRDYTGYVSSLRFINGTSNSASSPPTAPLTSTGSDTKLLTNFTNAGIIDHTMRNNLETEGNVRISGQQTKFGTGSIYFDGTGTETLKFIHSPNLNFGTGDFTLEFFIYFTSNPSGYKTVYSQGYGGTGGVLIQSANSSTALRFFISNNQAFQSDTFSLNTWYHVAWIRSGTDSKLFIDGTQNQSTATSYTHDANSTNNAEIGQATNGWSGSVSGGPYPFYGYIDEFRLTKGVARYTSNFTAPTEAFANR